jgi:lambda family phage minor tail protein L
MSESTSLSLQSDVQSLTPYPAVELFELDTTPITAVNGVTGPGAIYTWTPGTLGGAVVVFGDVTYTPIPVEFTDMKTAGQGTTPAPTIRVTSLGGLVGSLVASFNDLTGAKVTRIRTFADCLDGAANADPTAYLGPDVFYVDRKSHHDKTYIEFTLAVSYDQQGISFPRRQVIADSCSRSYRYWNGTKFIQGTCPYTGGLYFDTSGNATGLPQNDFCSKKLATGCIARFGTGVTLPTWAFPGAALTGIG